MVVDVDAAGRLSGAACQTVKVTSAARYIDTGLKSRVKTYLSAAEVSDLRTHHVALRPTWEIGADDVLSGRATAVAQAKKAVLDLTGLGMSDAVCWWTSDRDIVLANKAAVVAYAAGWAEVLGPERCGVYGDREVLDWVIGAGLARYGWQAGATSWSGGQISPHAHIVQTTRQTTVGGVSCDINNVVTSSPDYGQWPRVEDDVALTGAEIAAIAKAVWAFTITDPHPEGDPDGAPASSHLRWAQARTRVIQERLGVDGSTLPATPAPVSTASDVDEAKLAADLAPLLTAQVSHLTEADLADVARAVADEQARRLAAGATP